MLGLALLAGCGETTEQRATTGAVGGGAAGAVVGGPVGAVAGAGIGALAGANREKVDEGTNKATDATREKIASATERSGSATTTSRSADRVAGPGPTNEEVKQAQTALHNMGLYDGKIDGIYGRKTVAAVGKFQEKNSLRRTGTLDAPTQEKLQQLASSNGGTGDSSGSSDSSSTGGTRVNPQSPSGQGTPGGQPGVQPEAPPSAQQPQKTQ
jgi:peptidoglycan hydrolase-like protein with peptidoglycan-binding domain